MSCLFTLPVCVCFCIAVLATFRGTVQHGLPLEIGDTVQILEKCEGTTSLPLRFVPNMFMEKPSHCKELTAYNQK